MAYTTPKTWATSDILTAADLNTYVRDNIAALYGTTTSYTPTVSQGVSTNISKTVNEARYVQIGRLCACWGYVAMTGSGTAGSAVTVSLPLTASGHHSVALIGSGLVYDNSTTTRYVCTIELASTTTFSYGADGTTGGAVWGGAPNLALAGSDQLRWQIFYVVA